MVWAFTGLVHGMLIFFFILWILDYESMDSEGYPGGMAPFSLTVYSAIIVVINP